MRKKYQKIVVCPDCLKERLAPKYCAGVRCNSCSAKKTKNWLLSKQNLIDPVYKECINCKKMFRIGPSRKNRRRNCSLKCSYITRQTFYKSASWEQKVLHLKERFEKLVIKKDKDCWGWNGSLSSGYAQIAFENKPIKGSRASWLILNGKIPEGLFVCHVCNNSICTNPEHLYLGTHKQNMEDRKNCNRDPVGERNGMSKLKDEDVVKIKKMIANKTGGTKIARLFKVSPVTISQIKNGHRWNYKDRASRDLAAKEISEI